MIAEIPEEKVRDLLENARIIRLKNVDKYTVGLSEEICKEWFSDNKEKSE